MSDKQDKLKKKMESLVGKDGMEAVARKPIVILHSRVLFNKMCRSCRTKAMHLVMKGKAWDTGAMCERCKVMYEKEVEKWR